MKPVPVALLGLFVAHAGAQAHVTPLLSIADERWVQARLYSVDLAGQANVLAVFPFLVRPDSFTLHHDNRTLVLHSTNPDAVVLFDPVSQNFVGTLHSGAPLGNVHEVRPWHTGDYLVADSGAGGVFVRLVAADGSGLQTVFAPAGWNNQIRALAQDLFTGEILAGVLQIGPQAGPSLIRIDPGTGSFVVLDPMPRNITALVQDHRDGAVIYGEYTGGIHRRAPDGTIQTLIADGNPQGIRASSLAFDRADGNGILIAGGGDRIARLAFAPGGPVAVVHVHDQLPPLPMVAKDLAFARGENVIPVRTGRGTWRFEVDFAGEAGAPYVLAFSASGFTPGLVAGTRTVPLVSDGLFAASVTGGLSPYLQGGSGLLDGDGHGTATLDLRAFGGSLAGIRIWVAAVTADRLVPGTVGTVSRPRVLVLE